MSLALGLVLGLLPGFGVADADPERAARAYHAGRYEEALELYEMALTDQGVRRGEVLFNLGNCAYRLGRYPQAVLYYRRAQLRMSGDAELAFNLRMAQEQLGLYRPTDESWGLALVSGRSAGSPSAWLAFAVLLQTAGLLGVLLWRRTTLLPVAVAVLILGSLGAERVVQLQWFGGLGDGVVVADEIVLRREPHRDMPVTIRLEAGQTVQVAEWSDRWIRVVHTRGGGWTVRDGIGIVD